MVECDDADEACTAALEARVEGHCRVYNNLNRCGRKSDSEERIHSGHRA